MLLPILLGLYNAGVMVGATVAGGAAGHVVSKIIDENLPEDEKDAEAFINIVGKLAINIVVTTGVTFALAKMFTYYPQNNQPEE